MRACLPSLPIAARTHRTGRTALSGCHGYVERASGVAALLARVVSGGRRKPRFLFPGFHVPGLAPMAKARARAGDPGSVCFWRPCSRLPAVVVSPRGTARVGGAVSALKKKAPRQRALGPVGEREGLGDDLVEVGVKVLKKPR